MWDADFYVKVDDDVHVNIGKLHKNLLAVKDSVSSFPILISFFFVGISTATLGETLVRHRKKPRVYIGCMKSGPVLSQK